MHTEIFMMIYELFPHDSYNFHIINMTDFMKASNDLSHFSMFSTNVPCVDISDVIKPELTL